MLDERLISRLHMHAEHRELLRSGEPPNEIFQTSTVAALLDGAYEGDLSFAELARHGDLGLGTLNGLDGEMIALGGEFMQADIDGLIAPIEPDALTPFAVVVSFEPTALAELVGPLDHAALLAALDELIPAGSAACAVRVDGRFEELRARSVPRQKPPYRPLVEVAAEQRVFELGPTEGTLVGFRFPDWAEGVEISGFHLHYVDDERARGGHVLDCHLAEGRAAVDVSRHLHLELPRGVELPDSGLDEGSSRGLHAAE